MPSAMNTAIARFVEVTGVTLTPALREALGKLFEAGARHEYNHMRKHLRAARDAADTPQAEKAVLILWETLLEANPNDRITGSFAPR